MELSSGQLLTSVFVEFIRQLGWQRAQGVTRRGNLKSNSDYPDNLICKSSVKDICVQVVSEDWTDETARILTLSDGEFKIGATIWGNTTGLDASKSLLHHNVQLQEFDVSARYTPLDNSPEAHNLQFGLEIHQIVVDELAPPPVFRVAPVREQANVRSFLQEFYAWRRALIIPHAIAYSSNQPRAMAGLDIPTSPLLATQAPATSPKSSASVAGSSQLPNGQDSLRQSSQDVISPLPKREATRLKTRTRPQPQLSLEEEWRDLVQHGIRASDVRIPKAQEEAMQWAPHPSARHKLGIVMPSRDWEEMRDDSSEGEDADEVNDDTFIDLSQSHEADTEPKRRGSTTQEPDLIKHAQSVRRASTSPDASPLPESQWPASGPASPINNSQVPATQTRTSPKAESPRTSPGRETSFSPDRELPPDSDTELDKADSMDWLHTVDRSRALPRDHSPDTSGSHNGSVSSTHKLHQDEEAVTTLSVSPTWIDKLPQDEISLQRLFDAEPRASPQKALIFRELQAIKAKKAATSPQGNGSSRHIGSTKSQPRPTHTPQSVQSSGIEMPDAGQDQTGTGPVPPKRKTVSEEAQSSGRKRSRMWKVEFESTPSKPFELSQSLQQYAGSQYDVDKQRKAHFSRAHSPQHSDPQAEPESSIEPTNLQASEDRVEPRSSTASANEELNGAALDLFQHFKQNYPSWSGNSQTFIRRCKQLIEASIMKNFCDDFIILYDSAYRPYAFECLDTEKPVLPYDRWFEDQANSPTHRARILSRDVVLLFLQSLESSKSTSRESTPRFGGNSTSHQPAPMAARASRLDERLSSHSSPTQNKSSVTQEQVETRRRGLPWENGQNRVTPIQIDDDEPAKATPAFGQHTTKKNISAMQQTTRTTTMPTPGPKTSKEGGRRSSGMIKPARRIVLKDYSPGTVGLIPDDAEKPFMKYTKRRRSEQYWSGSN